VTLRHVDVLHRRSDVRVTGGLLDYHGALACFRQSRAEAVAEGMQAQLLPKAATSRASLKAAEALLRNHRALRSCLLNDGDRKTKSPGLESRGHASVSTSRALMFSGMVCSFRFFCSRMMLESFDAVTLPS